LSSLFISFPPVSFLFSGYEVIQVVATDLDEPNNDNSDIGYSIVSQEPTEPSSQMFVINKVTGMIRVNAGGLDREVSL